MWGIAEHPSRTGRHRTPTAPRPSRCKVAWPRGSRPEADRRDEPSYGPRLRRLQSVEDAIAEASPEQADALADGQVTEEEFTTSAKAWVECIRDAGYHVTLSRQAPRHVRLDLLAGKLEDEPVIEATTAIAKARAGRPVRS